MDLAILFTKILGKQTFTNLRDTIMYKHSLEIAAAA